MTAPVAAHVTLAGVRVLVLDDEYLVAKALGRVITGFGCHVVGPAMDVAEARDLIELDGVDVALLDIQLHDQTSEPIAQMLRARRCPFAFMSGYANTDFMSSLLHDQPCLEKPFGRAELLAALLDLTQAPGNA